MCVCVGREGMVSEVLILGKMGGCSYRSSCWLVLLVYTEVNSNTSPKEELAKE